MLASQGRLPKLRGPGDGKKFALQPTLYAFWLCILWTNTPRRFDHCSRLLAYGFMQQSQPLPWNQLSRDHQKVLERLWAGGTLRGRDPEIVAGLRLMGYIRGNRLTSAGERLCGAALIGMVERMKRSKAFEKTEALARH